MSKLQKINVGNRFPTTNQDGLVALAKDVNPLIDAITTLQNNSSGNISNSIYTIFNGLSAQGTSSSTTSILDYGVNIFTVVTTSNYAAKLPQPITGKVTKVVNMTSIPIALYPSNIGGQINNYAIDAPAIIPPDGNVYDFVCIENPLPGAWSWNAPATGQIQSIEFSVAHTNGVATNRFGVTQAGLTASSGASLSSGNIVLTGEWVSNPVAASVSTLKCYTNIVAADSASDPIVASLLNCYKTSANAVTSGQKITVTFDPDNYTDSFFAPTGALSSPPNVGDTATIYNIQDTITPLSTQYQIGLGGAFSRYYYQFGMFIPASAATKTYKFQFFLETI